MSALDLILIFAGIAGSLLVAAGCAVCFVVWLAGQGNPRRREVCAPPDES